ncbi:MAG TPA: hypothetical protein VE197_01110 [Mycobacterium sp.]|nr:hypothetical protein [Mycobacterium sp.]
MSPPLVCPEASGAWGSAVVLVWLSGWLARRRYCAVADALSSAGWPMRGMILGDGARSPRHVARRGLNWLRADLAEQHPLLLSLDDAYWADAASLRFLRFAAVRLDGSQPSCLIASIIPRIGHPADDIAPADADYRRRHSAQPTDEAKDCGDVFRPNR